MLAPPVQPYQDYQAPQARQSIPPRSSSYHVQQPITQQPYSPEQAPQATQPAPQQQEQQQQQQSAPPVESGTKTEAPAESQPPNIDDLPALQAGGAIDKTDQMVPAEIEDDPASYNLVEPAEGEYKAEWDLEARSKLLFSEEHLKVIFSDPSLLLKFTAFLTHNRPDSIPILVYYLDALKAIRAIAYANAVAEALDPIIGHKFTEEHPSRTMNENLMEKAGQAFRVLAEEELPAYITHLFTNIVSISIERRITGTLAPHLREASEGLAEVFCLTDPSRADNPIVFASQGKFVT